jgi:NitT/TauT family transport system permease protein
MSVDVQPPSGAAREQTLFTGAPDADAPRPAEAQVVTAGTVWSWIWPKLVAVGLVVAVWQILVWTHWRPDYVLPGPQTVAQTLWDQVTGNRLWSSISTTMQRAVTGYALAVLIGTLIGVAVVQWKVFRLGVGSLVAGMQTMPSIAWFPLAILLFGITEKAILFVVILGAAPSIASGVITGIDEVPPPLLRAGKMLGARGINRYRYIVLPAAMPAYVQGMKQGWAFSWRSLLAGELLVSVAGVTSIGGDLQLARQFGHPDAVLSLMVVILVIGMVVDSLFGVFTKRIRDKRGLTGAI